MDKYKNRYRISSTRLQNWDYGSAGAYFITICTKDKIHYFGEITNGKMELSDTGKLANKFWYEITNHFQQVELGEFVVMPNHVHGILILNGGNAPESASVPVSVETLHATSLPKSQTMASISPKPGSLSTIIRSYKSAVTRHAHRLNLEMAWQPRFYDHIIRNEKTLQSIAEYIRNNPFQWLEDELYTQ